MEIHRRNNRFGLISVVFSSFLVFSRACGAPKPLFGPQRFPLSFSPFSYLISLSPLVFPQNELIPLILEDTPPTPRGASVRDVIVFKNLKELSPMVALILGGVVIYNTLVVAKCCASFTQRVED